MAGEIDVTAGEPWTLRDEEGDALEVYAVEWDDPTEKLTTRVVVNVPTHDGPALGLPHLRALIAELTRRAALLAGQAGQAPVRTAEDERADVLAWLSDEYVAYCRAGSTLAATDAEDRIKAFASGTHVGTAGTTPVHECWDGPGYYTGRDDAGHPVLLHAATPAGLARIGAAAGVARWSGPHPSLGAAGKALDAEGGQ